MITIIQDDDRVFIDRLRGLSIIRVVLAHLGLSWFFTPYSQFILVFLPILFFVSGAVSFQIFLRSKSWHNYTFKRLSSVIIPYYVIAFALLAITFIFVSDKYLEDSYNLVRWILVSPSNEMTLFPLGQLWFIRALLIISLFSIPVFLYAQKNVYYLLLPVAVSLLAALAQTYSDIYKFFYIEFFNFYQPLVNSGFFFFGSFYYAFKDAFSKIIIYFLAFLSFSLSVSVLFHADLPINMSDSSFSPNLYYTGLSFFAIFLVLLMKPVIQSFLSKFGIIDRAVMLFSENAYSVFILHTLMIYISETFFGWENVIDDPCMAFFKITFVFVSSIAASIPVTAITKKTSKALVKYLYG